MYSDDIDDFIADCEEDVHCMPIGDLRDHEACKRCWCNPTYDEGVYVHHSLDGRESYETGERQLN